MARLVQCDKCGTILTSHWFIIKIFESEHGKETDKLDVCSDCKNRVVEYIEGIK